MSGSHDAHVAPDAAGSPIASGWTIHPQQQQPSGRSPRRRRLPGRRLVIPGIAAVVTLLLYVLSGLITGGNTASALVGHPEVLRPGCTWDSSGNYVQNCRVWSASMNKYIVVQVRASNGSDKGIYLLDGMRAVDTHSAWTSDVQAAKVYDSSTDTTLVMPAGGASSFYTDWNGPAGANTTIKQETFLTQELPDYLSQNFGVSKSGNAIVGLSMSAGPAVTLAEKHPEQFKVVQAMSGYYQLDNPIGALGVLASQTIVSNYTNGIVNMWGAPGSAQWAANDPSRNVDKLKENGQVLIISSGNGFLTTSEMAKLSQQDQISAMALEMLSAVSTVLMQLQLAQSGASVISLPNYGGHTWTTWDRSLTDGRDDLLAALRANPPVTTKAQVVSAGGDTNTTGVAAATAAARKGASTTVALPTVLAAQASSSGASPSAASPSGAASSDDPSSGTADSSVPSSDADDPSTSAPAGTTTPAHPGASESPSPASESPSVGVPAGGSALTTTTPVR
ncbi:alpha/beta hydrolase [Gordonia sp. NPDC003950]